MAKKKQKPDRDEEVEAAIDGLLGHFGRDGDMKTPAVVLGLTGDSLPARVVARLVSMLDLNFIEDVKDSDDEFLLQTLAAMSTRNSWRALEHCALRMERETASMKYLAAAAKKRAGQ